eukprot:381297_1
MGQIAFSEQIHCCGNSVPFEKEIVTEIRCKSIPTTYKATPSVQKYSNYKVPTLKQSLSNSDDLYFAELEETNQCKSSDKNPNIDTLKSNDDNANDHKLGQSSNTAGKDPCIRIQVNNSVSKETTKELRRQEPSCTVAVTKNHIQTDNTNINIKTLGPIKNNNSDSQLHRVRYRFGEFGDGICVYSPQSDLDSMPELPPTDTVQLKLQDSSSSIIHYIQTDNDCQEVLIEFNTCDNDNMQ